MATATYNTSLETAGATAAASAPTHAVIWDDAARTNHICNFDLSSTHSALANGQSVEFEADDLVFTKTRDANSPDYISDFGLVEELRGIFRADRYFTLASGSPGNDGTANRITQISSTLLDVSNLDFAV